MRTMASWHGTAEAVVPSSQSSCLLRSASPSALCGRTGLLRSNVWMTYIQSSLPKDLSIRLEKMASLQRSGNGLRTPSSHRGLWLCSLPVSLSPVGLSLRSPLGRRHLWSRNTRHARTAPATMTSFGRWSIWWELFSGGCPNWTFARGLA